MKKHDRCIVIGASAGGVETLREVVAGLPADLRVPVFVVLHIPPYAASILPKILAKACPLPVIHAKDGERVSGGTVYVASPDHHLLIEGGRVAVKRGPKENRFRPSIDALFRSAAHVYGPGAVGVVLSGALDDGTSGLWSIQRTGGTVVIQQPGDARFDSMPRSALEYVVPDHLLPAAEMGPLLGRLALEPVPAAPPMDPHFEKLLAAEVKIAAEGGAFQKGIMELGTLTPFTCPECHGALARILNGLTLRFRCHTGHAYTDSALLEGVMECAGEMLWQVIRTLEESVMLLNNMGTHLREAGDMGRAEAFFTKARILEKRSRAFHDAALDHESLSGDNLGQKPEN
ncbi:MAG: chemotaxis protein CheB [Verrucomicrobiaceae bacterium]|nr:MAG: chemotaxis protein CheB [Verrucomicrobiaceae bacterium]